MTDPLRRALNHFHREFETARFLAQDPLGLLRGFADPGDREVAGFIAATLALGRVGSIWASGARVLERLGPAPRAFLLTSDPRTWPARFRSCGHRWFRGRHIARLLLVLRRALERHGSLRAVFLRGYDPAEPDLGPAVSRFVEALTAQAPGELRRGLLPSPRQGSACKRLNLFLRWMVRTREPDCGLWPEVSPARLIIPLDRNIVEMGGLLRLTQRRTPDWTMAVEITAALRAADPEDPVKYDFALCYFRQSGACPARRDPRCQGCWFRRGLCRVWREPPDAAR